jgi:tetratricopeptide (TPR) repeat protein
MLLDWHFIRALSILKGFIIHPLHVRTRHLVKKTVGLALAGLLAVSGCSREQSPEETEADKALEQARQAVNAGDYGMARAGLLRAMALDTLLARGKQLAEETEQLALNYAATAQFDSAFLYYERSREFHRSVADRYGERRVRLAVASLHRWIGEEEQAYRIFSEMLRVNRVLDDVPVVTEILWKIIPSCRVLGHDDEETRYLTELLNASTTANLVAMQARVYYEWGSSHLYRDEYRAAAENFLRSFTLAEQAGDSVFAITCLAKLGLTYSRDGNVPGSFQTYTDALTRSDRISGSEKIREEMLVRIGNVYLGNRQYTEAERFFQAALRSAVERKDRLAEGYLFIQLGHCLAESRARRPEALRNYQIAMELFSSVSYSPGMAYALGSLAMAAQREGRPAEALRHLEAAAGNLTAVRSLPEEDDLYEECERTFWKLHGSGIRENYIELLLLQGKAEEAFTQEEKRRAADLVSAFGSFTFDGGRQELTARIWEAQRYRALTTGATRQLAVALSDAEGNKFLIDHIHASIDGYGKLLADAAERIASMEPLAEPIGREIVMTVADVQRALPPGATLLAPVPTTRSVYVYAISKTGWTVQLSAVEKSRFAQLSTDYAAGIRTAAQMADSVSRGIDRMRARNNELGAALYSALIRPVESFLSGTKELVIVPPEKVVPFHALRRSGGGASGRYLIQRYPVRYIPSAASLRVREDAVMVAPDIVGVGHAGTTSWDVEYELRDIRAFHKDARLYFGKEATVMAVKREHGTVLHLAAEFRYDRRWPGNSVVLFSDGQTGETTTPIQWGRILSFPRFPTIVVSDLGEHDGIPLVKPSVLLMTGSQSVVLTSYPAHRKTKKYFGEVFYTSLTGGRSAGESYRSTIIGMIDNPEYAAPHIWAPFFLWGK